MCIMVKNALVFSDGCIFPCRALIFRASAVASIARNHARNFQFLLHAVCHIFQIEAHTHTQVATTLHATATTATTMCTAESAETESAENVAELRENVVHRHASTTAAESALRSSETELVVTSTLVFVRQHVVGLSRFLELLLGGFLFLVALALLTVGVIFDSQLAVGFLQFIICGILLNAKHFIIVSFFCHFAEKLINSILLTHYHFSVAKHFFINSVTLLHSVDHLALHTLVGGRESGDSLINIGIEVGTS